MILTAVSRLAIFTGAFLVFLVEPLIANILTPYFGGTATVWTVTLATFQVLLLVGYNFADVLAHSRFARCLRVAYVAVLLLCACWLFACPVRVSGIVEAVSGCHPILAVFLSICLIVGIPFVGLSVNSSFVQHLVAKDRSGYNLYAISNLGSFAGLLAYPLVLEQFCTTDVQLRIVGGGVLAYAVMLSALLLGVPKREEGRSGSRGTASVGWEGAGAWFALSALSTFVLNAATTHICMEIAPLPLMWAVILSLYLLSYIVSFSPLGARIGRLLGWPLVGLVLCAAWFMLPMISVEFLFELALVLGLLFVGCWNVHARLYDLRPEAERLTRYYLVLALGGAVGGLVSSMLCPVVFDTVVEYPLAVALLLVVPLGEMAEKFALRRDLCWVAVALVGFVAFERSQWGDGAIRCRKRNFYGVSVVRESKVKAPGCSGMGLFEFMNNGTMHGRQLVEYGRRKQLPTTYYTPNGGGVCIDEHPKRLARRPMRAAFLGMGVGTLASYGAEGDFFRFYEINPDVVEIARDERCFNFLQASSAEVDVVVDDARKALERERAEGAPKYDLIVVDVFSGDSIPAHLGTAEALDLYLDRLNEGGILAFHLTNWHMNLLPMVKAMADARNLSICGWIGKARGFGNICTWACMTRKPVSFREDDDRMPIDFSRVDSIPLMTDARHSLLPYLSKCEKTPILPRRNSGGEE